MRHLLGLVPEWAPAVEPGPATVEPEPVVVDSGPEREEVAAEAAAAPGLEALALAPAGLCTLDGCAQRRRTRQSSRPALLVDRSRPAQRAAETRPLDRPNSARRWLLTAPARYWRRAVESRALALPSAEVRPR